DGRSQEVWLNWNPISGPRRENNVPIHLSVTAAIQTNDTSNLFALARERYEQCLAYLDGDLQQYGWYGVFGPEGTQDRIAEYRNRDLGVLNAYYGPPTETAFRRGSTLESLELETFTGIIIGQRPLDDFDTFVQDWKRLGGDDWTAEINEWADSK
ncbi:MAG: hypothetical protein KAU31_15810, partial [Spirochaetaceae bacterium]|nr:hypothetical protein [Spirochaetaceae bacterium]